MILRNKNNTKLSEFLNHVHVWLKHTMCVKKHVNIYFNIEIWMAKSFTVTLGNNFCNAVKLREWDFYNEVLTLIIAKRVKDSKLTWKAYGYMLLLYKIRFTGKNLNS